MIDTITNPGDVDDFGAFHSKIYHGMEYVCEKCGRTVEFDGQPVTTRTCLPDDGTCFGDLQLQNAESYRNNEQTPDEVWVHAY